MITVNTTISNMHIFLALTGHAFAKSQYDPNSSHGFYWAMRWLARKVIGESWMLWITQRGGE